MLVEVLISAVLVALIVLATLNGFDVTSRATADERAHAQATVIAQQDEERLRGMTSAQLGQLGGSTQTVAENGQCVEQASGAWRYCEGHAAYTGTVFTVASSAQYVTAAKEAFTCETKEGSADYLQTTSSVKWPALGERPAVTQSSLVSTAAGGAALAVRVKNRDNEPVAGATVTATGAVTHAEQLTPTSGCVIFGALADKTVNVVAFKTGWVDRNGKSPPPAQAIDVSPGALATAEFTIEAPGAIAAEFESNGSSVTSDTFYALQNEISSPPDFVGGTVSAYAHTVELTGLFPFVTPGSPPKANPYAVFAGDCEANNPALVTAGGEKLKAPTAQVEPGQTTHVKVEAPAINVTVYEGESGAKPEKVITKAESAKIVNKECSAATAQNFAKVPYEHKVTISSEGHLEPKYQPYAKQIELCVVAFPIPIAGTNYYVKSKATFANTAKAGTAALVLYMKSAGYSKSVGKLEC